MPKLKVIIFCTLLKILKGAHFYLWVCKRDLHPLKVLKSPPRSMAVLHHKREIRCRFSGISVSGNSNHYVNLCTSSSYLVNYSFMIFDLMIFISAKSMRDFVDGFST